jgi:hypothetical protein
MAKSFKQNLESNEQSKPNSQKDILDFFDEERSEKHSPIPTVTPVLLEEKKEKQVIESIEELIPLDVRQTFVIGSDYLEKTKNYVHLQRINGSYEYSQKNAIHDALDLLFKDLNIPDRPQKLKDKEKSRAQRIKNGKIS